jgi:hypothetical protein
MFVPHCRVCPYVCVCLKSSLTTTRAPQSEGQNGPVKKALLPRLDKTKLLRRRLLQRHALLSSLHQRPPPTALPTPRVRRRRREIRGAMWRSCVSRGLSRAKASASRLLSTASVRLIRLTPLNLISSIVGSPVCRCSDGRACLGTETCLSSE